MKEADVETFLQELGERADASGLSALTPAERVLLLPWAARGVIGNGGFRYFLAGTWDLAAVAGAFRALGFAAAAIACEQVLAAAVIVSSAASRGTLPEMGPRR